MDILYIIQETKDRMRTFCQEELIDYVFNDFSRHAVIKDGGEGHPTKYWAISDYIQNNIIDVVDKMNVILSFMICGGIVEFNERYYLDINKLIVDIKLRHLIDDDQLEAIYEPWYQYIYRRKTPHFTMPHNNAQ